MVPHHNPGEASGGGDKRVAVLGVRKRGEEEEGEGQ